MKVYEREMNKQTQCKRSKRSSSMVYNYVLPSLILTRIDLVGQKMRGSLT